MKLLARISILVAPVAVAAFALASAAAGGGGRVIDVQPGGLKSALGRASDGDTLMLHQGRYRGSFTISERVKLVGAPGEKRPLIDGRCRTRAVIEVVTSGVVIRRLHVVGSDESAGAFPSSVEFTRVGQGRITDSLLRDTCDAEYGVNVFDSGRVVALRNRAHGFSDAGIYVGAITDTGAGTLLLAGNETLRNNRGVIVEDSSGGRIVIRGNSIHDNTAPGEGTPSGIFVRNSDGALIQGNTVVRNGELGVHLDPRSDRNRFFGNRFEANPRNVLDEGDGNCGRRNAPNAFPAC